MAKVGGHARDPFDGALRGAGAHRYAGELSDREGVSVHLPDERHPLDCAIPFSMAVSRGAGGVSRRWSWVTPPHGSRILVLTDAYVRGANDAGSNPALGDFIVLLAAFGYASSNVLQEAALLDGASAVEVLAHVGGFGAVFSGIQCLTLELDSLARLNATAGAAGIAELATFAASLFAMYSLVPEVLRRCGAAAFNVGMLSSDVWAFVARVFFFGGFGDIRAVLAFFASFFVVSAGLVVFRSGRPSAAGTESQRRDTRRWTRMSTRLSRTWRTEGGSARR